jgi:hypothetical protein
MEKGIGHGESDTLPSTVARATCLRLLVEERKEATYNPGDGIPCFNITTRMQRCEPGGGCIAVPASVLE